MNDICVQMFKSSKVTTSCSTTSYSPPICLIVLLLATLPTYHIDLLPTDHIPFLLTTLFTVWTWSGSPVWTLGLWNVGCHRLCTPMKEGLSVEPRLILVYWWSESTTSTCTTTTPGTTLEDSVAYILAIQYQDSFWSYSDVTCVLLYSLADALLVLPALTTWLSSTDSYPQSSCSTVDSASSTWS